MVTLALVMPMVTFLLVVSGVRVTLEPASSSTSEASPETISTLPTLTVPNVSSFTSAPASIPSSLVLSAALIRPAADCVALLYAIHGTTTERLPSESGTIE